MRLDNAQRRPGCAQSQDPYPQGGGEAQGALVFAYPDGRGVWIPDRRRAAARRGLSGTAAVDEAESRLKQRLEAARETETYARVFAAPHARGLRSVRPLRAGG